jgi:hypothetical protein|tara:strand:+ start:874 stop:1158 length:285 start_codon:yes stop_codon:yes gene_type:complete
MNNMTFGEFKVEVETTDNRGFTAEEVAHRCVGKIVAFSEDAHPALRDQAIAYRDSIEKLLVIYMKQAIQSDRTTVYNAIKEAGHPTLAEYIRKM